MIRLTQLTTGKWITKKEYHIKGNGHTISEANFKKPVTSATYQAKSWSVNHNKLLEMKLQGPVDLSMFNQGDRLLIRYEAWFRRLRANIVSISDSLIMFQCDNKILDRPQKYVKRTPSPYFWLEKAEGKGNTISTMFWGVMKLTTCISFLIEKTSVISKYSLLLFLTIQRADIKH